MIDTLNYLFATVAVIASVLLVYLTIQIYSSNNPYRSDD